MHWSVRDSKTKRGRLSEAFMQATAHAAEAFYSLAHRELRSQLNSLPPSLDGCGRRSGSCMQCLASIDQSPQPRGSGEAARGLQPARHVPRAVCSGRRTMAGRPRRRAAHRARWWWASAASARRWPPSSPRCCVRAGGRCSRLPCARRAIRTHAQWIWRQVWQFGPASLGLVVDEGPGISGSSMAATAAAWSRRGWLQSGIAFLPGHGNEPGGAGAPEVQRWWQMAPRYVAEQRSAHVWWAGAAASACRSSRHTAGANRQRERRRVAAACLSRPRRLAGHLQPLRTCQVSVHGRGRQQGAVQVSRPGGRFTQPDQHGGSTAPPCCKAGSARTLPRRVRGDGPMDLSRLSGWRVHR